MCCSVRTYHQIQIDHLVLAVVSNGVLHEVVDILNGSVPTNLGVAINSDKLCLTGSGINNTALNVGVVAVGNVSIALAEGEELPMTSTWPIRLPL